MTGLAKLEEYKAPWEVDSTGAEIPEESQQVDKAALKRYLHGVLSDKARLQTTVATVTGERDTLKTEADKASRANEDDAAKVERERQEAITAAKAEGGLPALKLDVALDVEGITAKQAKTLAKSLSGQTREELVASAEELVEAFGLVRPAAGEGDGEDAAEEPRVVPGRPRVARANGDPNPTAKALPDPKDPAAMAAAFPR